MKFNAIVEYEYPVEHKTPVKAELILHGDSVVTENIKWQRTGHWIECEELSSHYADVYKCSACGRHGEEFIKFKFCPHCGAEMEVKEDE